MKKHIGTIGKGVGFFILWLTSIAVIAVPAIGEPSFLHGNPALLRLWWELLPMLGVFIATAIFILGIERNKIRIPILNNPVKNIAMGLVLGCIWLGAVMVFLFLIGVFAVAGKNDVSYLPIWFFAVLLNVIMQNYLVRGYLFELFREKYNTVTAVIITTILFMAMHGGAFEAGAVAVINVVTMSVFVSLLLIYTKSLLAPIIAHFIWNSVGRLIFGVVSLADDYPNLWNSSLTGNDLLSGGLFKIEGSVVVLVMNVMLIVFMAYLLRTRGRNE